MFSPRQILLILALTWCIEENSSTSILIRPIERAEQAINGLATVSLGAIKTALDVVEGGLDAAIETRNIIVEKLKDEIEKFRRKMGAGIPELGIPTLEPLDIKHVDFHIKHEIGIFDGYVDKVRVEDLSLFVVNSMNYTFPYKIKLNIIFPTVRVRGAYSIEGVLGDMFKIEGNGPFNFTLLNLNVHVNPTLGFKNEAFYLKTLEMDVSLGGMKSNFQNLMGGGELERVFNKVIEDLAPEAVDMLWPELKDDVTERVRKMFQINLIPKRIMRYTDKLTDLFSIRRIFHMLNQRTIGK